MMFAELNASNYSYSGVFYNTEFEHILSKVLTCYQLMLADNSVLINDENKIRDVLYTNYLNCDEVRKSIELQNYYFDREISEDRTTGRTDIRILNHNTFKKTEAYYIIECKRLDAINPNGTTGLNAKYIENGICRFTAQTYSSYYKTNGLIGFVVESMDVDQNVISINTLLKEKFSTANTTQELLYKEILKGFSFSYYSIHTIDKNSVTLYHLMLDFSRLIK